MWALLRWGIVSHSSILLGHLGHRAQSPAGLAALLSEPWMLDTVVGLPRMFLLLTKSARMPGHAGNLRTSILGCVCMTSVIYLGDSLKGKSSYLPWLESRRTDVFYVMPGPMARVHIRIAPLLKRYLSRLSPKWQDQCSSRWIWLFFKSNQRVKWCDSQTLGLSEGHDEETSSWP